MDDGGSTDAMERRNDFDERKVSRSPSRPSEARDVYNAPSTNMLINSPLKYMSMQKKSMKVSATATK